MACVDSNHATKHYSLKKILISVIKESIKQCPFSIFREIKIKVSCQENSSIIHPCYYRSAKRIDFVYVVNHQELMIRHPDNFCDTPHLLIVFLLMFLDLKVFFEYLVSCAANSLYVAFKMLENLIFQGSYRLLEPETRFNTQVYLISGNGSVPNDATWMARDRQYREEYKSKSIHRHIKLIFKFN